MRQAAGGSVLELVVRHGPRFVRDACGPVLVFYAGWKLVGLETGIAGATALAVVAYLWERRQSRSGLSPAIGLGIALVQAVAGLMSSRTLWYFAPSLMVNAACGVAFAVETSAFSSDVMASSLFRSVCSQISLVWAVYLLGGSLARLVVLLRSGVDFYLAVHFFTGFPLAAAVMGWSVWYGARRLLGPTRSLT